MSASSRMPEDPRQQPLDFARGQQLALLHNCELPRDAKDKHGSGIKAGVLKTVLLVLDNYSRGRDRGAYPAIASIAKRACIGRRTAQRALEILQRIGVLCVENEVRRHGRYGSPTNTYTIVWSELALLVDRGLFEASRRDAALAGQSAKGNPPSGGDQSATRGALADRNQSATLTDQSATRGTQNVSETTREALSKAPSETTEAEDVVGDVDGDGARFFCFDQVESIRERANQLNRWAWSRTPEDRELILKVATLWHDGALAEDQVQQVLESFRRKREQRIAIQKPCGWLWTTLKNQCADAGTSLERQLARTDFPRELLLPPRAADEQITGGVSLETQALQPEGVCDGPTET